MKSADRDRSTFWGNYSSVLLGGGRELSNWISESRLGRIPVVARTLVAVRHAVANRAIPDRREWVRIRGGIGTGLWICANLAHERHWWSGAHEPEVQEYLRRHIRPNEVFYDIGAHFGFYSLAAAQLTARVVAFEADPENLERLASHVERNGLSERVRIVGAAVWSYHDTVLAFQRGFPRSQGGVAAHGIQPVLASGPVIEVNSITIDEFVYGGALPPDFIKIDVEGGEGEVLSGAMDTIRRYAPRLMIEVHHREARTAVELVLQQLSYDAEWCVPFEQFPQQCFASHS